MHRDGGFKGQSTIPSREKKSEGFLTNTCKLSGSREPKYSFPGWRRTLNCRGGGASIDLYSSDCSCLKFLFYAEIRIIG